MIGYDEALAIIRAAARRLPAQRLAPVRGLVLAEDVVSDEDLPPFDNSAMDGFALCVGEAGIAAGGEFDVAGAQAAGDAQVAAMQGAASPGAWEIMTGARLPDGLDAVVPVEQVEVLARDADGRPLRIRVLVEVARGQHIRLHGEDVARGDRALAAGTRLEAPQLMLLAALGVSEVTARRPPRMALLNTGRELVDDPAQPLAAEDRLGACVEEQDAAALVHGDPVVSKEQAKPGVLQRLGLAKCGSHSQTIASRIQGRRYQLC